MGKIGLSLLDPCAGCGEGEGSRSVWLGICCKVSLPVLVEVLGEASCRAWLSRCYDRHHAMLHANILQSPDKISQSSHGTSC
jgi:hypothetical protein